MRTNYITRILLIGFLYFTGLAGSWGQSGSVSGTITDKKGETVPGVSVIIQGSTIGAITDVNGKYKIENLTAGNYKLAVSFVGYETQVKDITLKEGENLTLDTKIFESAVGLKEMVVVGYGTQVKREVTGSISTIKSNSIESLPVQSFTQALQGKAAGLQIVQSNGALGSATRVRVRGQGSLSGSGDPLYVIDGVPVNNNDVNSKEYGATSAISIDPLSSINMDDIENITILKDASAAAIYGARSANGVILITTKRGKSEGKTDFNLTYTAGISNAASKIKLLNGDEFRQLYYQAYQNDSVEKAKTSAIPLAFPTSFNTLPMTKSEFLNSTTNTDWYDEVFRTGVSHELNLSARGGSEKTRFYLSGGYNNTDGFLRGNHFERFGARLNLDNNASDKLTLGVQLAPSFTTNKQVQTSYNGGLGAAQSTALPIFPIYNDDGTYYGQLAGVEPANTKKIYNTNNNPTAQLKNDFTTTVFRNLSNVYLNYKIIEGLDFRSDFGIDYFEQKENFFFSPVNRYYKSTIAGTTENKVGPLGALKQRDVNSVKWNTNNTLKYSKTFMETHHAAILIGTSQEKYNQKDIGFYPNDAVGFNDPYFEQTSGNMDFASWIPAKGTSTAPYVKDGPKVTGYNSSDFYKFSAFFGRINYDFKQKYLVQFSLRRDGSSRFGPNNRFGWFPSGSVGWVITDENFMSALKDNYFLKLRGGYGLLGNADIGNFAWLGTYGQSGGYAGQTGFAPTKIPNSDLTWEKSRQATYGLDFGLFKDRITGSFEYFFSKSTAILLLKQVQISATGNKELTVNSDVVIGNKGWEASVTSRNLVKKLIWTTDVNISSYKNKVLSAKNIGVDAIDAGPGDQRLIEGQPVGISFLAEYAGIDPETGNQTIKTLDGEIIQITSKTPASVQQDNRKPVGHPFPKFFGGINNTFSFMNIDLSILFTYSYGNTIYDDGAKYQYGFTKGSDTWNARAELKDHWTGPDDNSDVQRLTLNQPFGNNDINNTTRFLYDASYLRLKTISLGYTIPQKISEKIKLTRLRVFATAQNLFIWTKYPGWDPEVTRYADGDTDAKRRVQGNVAFASPYLGTPQTRTFLFGLNLGF